MTHNDRLALWIAIIIIGISLSVQLGIADKFTGFASKAKPACNDKKDNDKDGLIDMYDPSCSKRTDKSERGNKYVCDNNRDDDKDKKKDYRTDGKGDPGCSSPIDQDERDANASSNQTTNITPNWTHNETWNWTRNETTNITILPNITKNETYNQSWNGTYNQTQNQTSNQTVNVTPCIIANTRSYSNATNKTYNLSLENRWGFVYNLNAVVGRSNNKIFSYAFNTSNNSFYGSNTSLYGSLVYTEKDFGYFTLQLKDFFVLSDNDNRTDKTAVSHVIQYYSLDLSNRQVLLEDLATGTRRFTYQPYDNGTCILGSANIVISGNTYKLYLSNGTNYSFVDMDNDGNFTNHTINFVNVSAYNSGSQTFNYTHYLNFTDYLKP